MIAFWFVLGLLAQLVALPAALLAQFDFPLAFGDNIALAAVVVGFAMPPVIDAINRRTWASEAKAVSAFALCIPAALLVVYVMGYWRPEDWLRTFLIIFAAAIAFHRFYWKPSGISDAIAKATG